jgi:hypothetical protein
MSPVTGLTYRLRAQVDEISFARGSVTFVLVGRQARRDYYSEEESNVNRLVGGSTDGDCEAESDWIVTSVCLRFSGMVRFQLV